MNKYTGTHIEYHILQSFPVTCLNRDDVGAPKTAVIGGATRARVSSQSWKRQVRMALRDLGVRLAVRTKKVEQVMHNACLLQGASEEQAQACAEAMAKAFSKDTLFFFSPAEAEAFAKYAAEKGFDAKALSDKDLAKLSKKVTNSAMDGLDIALFGRMVAQQPDMNISGAASFAHAISTHRVANEIDYFTALDDLNEDVGSSHIGVLEFNSATYYRYISLDLGQLLENLEEEDLSQAVALFTKALYIAVPAARQNTQSGAGSWDYARIFVRKGQRLQASFDSPVKAGEGWLKPSITELDAFLALKEKQAGSLFGKQTEVVLGPDSDTSIDDIVAALQAAL